MITLFGAISFYLLEFGKNLSIHNSLDALYWTLATESTVGYGDIVAVTNLGKILSVGLMIAGIGIYASLAGLLAGYLARESKQDELRERIEKVDKRLDELIKRIKKAVSRVL